MSEMPILTNSLCIQNIRATWMKIRKLGHVEDFCIDNNPLQGLG